MKKILTLCLAAVLLPIAGWAVYSSISSAPAVTGDEVPTYPIDVTSLIVNPQFNDGFDGWSGEVGAGAKKGSADNYVITSYGTTFDVYQTIENLEPGIYTLKAGAFSRPLSNTDTWAKILAGEEVENYTFLYANGTEKAVLLIVQDMAEAAGSGNWTELKDGGETVGFVPDNSGAFSVAFANGLYENELKFRVRADGKATIGIKATSAYSNVGTVYAGYDNFRLYYDGPFQTTEEESNALLATVPSGKMNKNIADALNFAVQNLMEDRTNTDYYNSLEEAIHDANKSIEAYATLAAALAVTPDLNEAGLAKYEELIADIVDRYDASELADEDCIKAAQAIPGFACEAAKAQGPESDMTLAIPNAYCNINSDGETITTCANTNKKTPLYWTCSGEQDFCINGWSTEGNSDGSDMKVPFVQYWTTSSLLDNAVIKHDQVSGLPAGNYTISILARTLQKKANLGEIAYPAEGAVFYANNDTIELSTGKDCNYDNGAKTGKYDRYTLDIYIADGNLDFGFVIDNPDFYFFSFKDVQLYYKGNIDGVTPGTYFVYNDKSGRFLSRGEDWTTRATADEYGLAVNFIDNGDGTYKLKYADAADNKYLFVADGVNIYTDNNGSSDWIVEKTGLSSFLLKNRDTQKYASELTQKYLEFADDAESATEWTLVSADEHKAIVDAKLDAQFEDVLAKAGVNKYTVEGMVETLLEGGYDPIASFQDKYQTGTFNSAWNNQVVNGLEPGLYKVSVQGYSRMTGNDVAFNYWSNGFDSPVAYLYANNVNVPLHSVYDFSFDEILSTDWRNWEHNGKNYPNGDISGMAAFEQGAYVNEAYVYVEAAEGEETGSIQFGIKNPSNANNGNWIGYANFQLYSLSRVEEPEAPNVDDFCSYLDLTGEKEQYLYNVEGEGFLSYGNDWGTRATLTNATTPTIIKVTPADGGATYRLVDYTPHKGWSAYDCDGNLDSWCDGGNRGGDGQWNVIPTVGGKTFKLTNNVAGEGKYFGMVNTINDTRIRFTDNPDDDIMWVAFDSLEQAQDYIAAMSEYETEYEEWLKNNYDLLIPELLDEVPTGKMNNDVQQALTEAINNLSDEETYENFIALEKAIEKAVQSIADYENAADKLAGMKKLTESTNLYSIDAYDEYYGQWMMKYTIGTLTSDEIRVLQNPYDLTGWHADITCDEFLLDAWDVAPNFAGFYYINTWSTEGENDGSGFKTPFFEYWTDDNNSLGARDLNASAFDLDEGTYEITAWVRVRVKNGQGDAEPFGISMVANGQSVEICGDRVGNSQMYLQEYKVTCEVGESGELDIAFDVEAGNNISWLSFQNVRYERVPKALTLDYTAEADCGTYYNGLMLSVEMDKIYEALGVESIDDLDIYAVLGDGTWDPDYKLGTTDGWRDIDGMWKSWGDGPEYYCKADFARETNQIYELGGYPTKTDDPITYTATYAFTKKLPKPVLRSVLVEEIEQDQGTQYDDFARATVTEGEGYTQYTINADLTVAIKNKGEDGQGIDVCDCEKVVIEFAEPVPAGWFVSYSGVQSPDAWNEVPAGATSYTIQIDGTEYGETGVLPEFTLMNGWTGEGAYPLICKVKGIYKYYKEAEAPEEEDPEEEDPEEEDPTGATYEVVYVNINLQYNEVEEQEYDVVEDFQVTFYDKANTEYSGLTPEFDAASVAECLGIASLENVQCFIVNQTNDEFKAPGAYDGWRNVEGDAQPWPELEDGYCIKLNTPAEGKFDYAGAKGTNFNVGDEFQAKWAIVYDGKAVILSITVFFNEDGNDPVAINGIADTNKKAQGVYNVAGQKLQGLQKGLNIVDGKKVLVK